MNHLGKCEVSLVDANNTRRVPMCVPEPTLTAPARCMIYYSIPIRFVYSHSPVKGDDHFQMAMVLIQLFQYLIL